MHCRRRGTVLAVLARFAYLVSLACGQATACIGGSELASAFFFTLLKKIKGKIFVCVWPVNKGSARPIDFWMKHMFSENIIQQSGSQRQ